MDWDFAAIGQLVRTLPASYPVLVHRLATLLHASFRPRLAASVISPLRFAMTSPPSGCQRDFHPRAVEHARHTKRRLGMPSLRAHESKLEPLVTAIEFSRSCRPTSLGRSAGSSVPRPGSCKCVRPASRLSQ